MKRASTLLVGVAALWTTSILFFYSGCCETTHDHPAAHAGLMGRHLQDLVLTLTAHLSGTFPRPLTGTKLAKIRAPPTPRSPTVHHSKGQHNTIALVLFWTPRLALHRSLYLEQALTLTPILIHTHLSLSITATQVRKQLGVDWGGGWVVCQRRAASAAYGACTGQLALTLAFKVVT